MHSFGRILHELDFLVTFFCEHNSKSKQNICSYEGLSGLSIFVDSKVTFDCWQSVFHLKSGREYEAKRFSLKGIGTRHGLGVAPNPFSSIPPRWRSRINTRLTLREKTRCQQSKVILDLFSAEAECLITRSLYVPFRSWSFSHVTVQLPSAIVYASSGLS